MFIGIDTVVKKEKNTCGMVVHELNSSEMANADNGEVSARN